MYPYNFSTYTYALWLLFRIEYMKNFEFLITNKIQVCVYPMSLPASIIITPAARNAFKLTRNWTVLHCTRTCVFFFFFFHVHLPLDYASVIVIFIFYFSFENNFRLFFGKLSRWIIPVRKYSRFVSARNYKITVQLIVLKTRNVAGRSLNDIEFGRKRRGSRIQFAYRSIKFLFRTLKIQVTRSQIIFGLLECNSWY